MKNVSIWNWNISTQNAFVNDKSRVKLTIELQKTRISKSFYFQSAAVSRYTMQII